MMATLTVTSSELGDKKTGMSIAIGPYDSFFIGRDPEQCFMSFASDLMSRLHFRIYSIPAGIDEDSQSGEVPSLIYCEDRKSVNGTYVNDVLIGSLKSPRNAYMLNDGDIVRILPHWRFRFSQPFASTVKDFTPSQVRDMKVFEHSYKLSNRVLGTGKFGAVYAAYEIVSHRQLACKVLNTSVSNQGPSFQECQESSIDREKALKEVEILRRISHPNILTFHQAFYSDEHMYILTDLAPGGDLLGFMRINGTILDDSNACVVCHQLLMAIDYIHSQNIIHRDIKAENILFMQSQPGSRAVLSDFGSATIMVPGLRMQSLVGTRDYLAPEMSRDRIRSLNYTPAIDLWSLGIVAVCALTAIILPPKALSSLSKQALADTLASAEGPIQDANTWQGLSSHARDFIGKLVVIDPEERFNAKEALSHDWFEGNREKRSQLDTLYDITKNSWTRKPVTKDSVVCIQSKDSDGKTKGFRKLPDMTASAYFGLDRHLQTEFTSKTHRQRNRRLVLGRVNAQHSTTSDDLSQQHSQNLKAQGKSVLKSADLSSFVKNSRLVIHKPLLEKDNRWRFERSDSSNLEFMPGNHQIERHSRSQSLKQPIAPREIDPLDIFGNSPLRPRDGPHANDGRFASQVGFQGSHESSLRFSPRRASLRRESAPDASNECNYSDESDYDSPTPKRHSVSIAYTNNPIDSTSPPLKRQAIGRGYSVSQDVYEETWKDLHSKSTFVSAKTLKDGVESRRANETNKEKMEL